MNSSRAHNHQNCIQCHVSWEIEVIKHQRRFSFNTVRVGCSQCIRFSVIDAGSTVDTWNIGTAFLSVLCNLKKKNNLEKRFKERKSWFLPLLTLVEISGASEEKPWNENASKSGKQRPKKKAWQKRCLYNPRIYFSQNGVAIQVHWKCIFIFTTSRMP